MARRTLRRAYGGTTKRTGDDTGRSVSNPADVPNIDGTEQDDDRVSLDAGIEYERESDHTGDAPGDTIIDPARIDEYTRGRDSDSGNGGTRKRRADAGKPRGKRRVKETSQTIDASVIQLVHMMAASILHTPELCLSEDEAKQLEERWATFCEYHDMPMIDPKTISTLMLIGCAGKIYAPRIVAAIHNRKQERIKKQREKITAMPQVSVL